DKVKRCLFFMYVIEKEGGKDEKDRFNSYDTIVDSPAFWNACWC
ncbi:unnamed protein product, partial [marine sediment metagenome]